MKPATWTTQRCHSIQAKPATSGLERGPAQLSSHGELPQDIAAALAHDLRQIAWATGAKQEVASLLARCEALASQARGPNLYP